MISAICLALICSIALPLSISAAAPGAGHIPSERAESARAANDVLIILDTSELMITPDHYFPMPFHMEGYVEWNVTSAPITMLYAHVELYITEGPFSASCDPPSIHLTRAENIKRFRFTLTVPPKFASGRYQGLVEGYWTYNGQPMSQQQGEPIPFGIDVLGYSNIFVRGYDGETLRLNVGKWTSVPITMINNGNAPDAYTIGEAGSSQYVRTRFDKETITLQPGASSVFVLEVMASKAFTGTENVVLSISTQHPLKNSTSGITLMFITDGSTPISEGRTVGIALGIIAFVVLAAVAAAWAYTKVKYQNFHKKRGPV